MSVINAILKDLSIEAIIAIVVVWSIVLTTAGVTLTKIIKTPKNNSKES